MVIFCLLARTAPAWLLLLPLAWAQAPEASPPNPPVPVARGATWGAASVPEGANGLHYVSVLGPYQAYAEQAVTSWPQANAAVERIGGWRAYAKEAASPALTPQPPGAQP